MEDFQEESKSRTTRIADRVYDLEQKLRVKEMEEETKQEKKEFKWPWKWGRKFKQANKKKNKEMMLVFFLNKKGEMEPPMFMPIFDGNMIIYRNKPYEFDPRAVWNIKGMKGNPRAYIIKEIDRRPVKNKYGKWVYSSDAAVTNMDVDEIRERHDSTESDEFLIKAALKAQQVQANKRAFSIIGIIVVVVIIGVVMYFLLK